MPYSVLLPQFLLPLSAIRLGRFVVNINEPHEDYYDPVHDTSSNTTEKVLTEYGSTQSAGNQRSFAAELTSLLSSSFSKSAKTSVQISSDQAKTYYLQNTAKWFREAVQHEDTRRWIEQTIAEEEEIYVVVGYHTLLDARIVERSDGQKSYKGKAVLPVNAALAANGIVAPLGDLVDPGLEASRERTEDEQREFVAQGEQICAVQFRKVRHRWFSSKSIDKITLAQSHWERYDRPRYLRNDVNEMIEVDLDDEMAFEGDRNKCAIGDDNFLSASIQNA